MRSSRASLGLSLTVWVLDGATLAAVIVILIVFQAELRRALVRLDVIAWLLPQRQSIVAQSLQAVAAAAFSLAHARRGALMVVAGDAPLDELVEGGVPLGGAISTEILEAIFRKVSPVHDGAAIIKGDHIARVGTVLPLTQRRDVPHHYGTRHRAAMGLAERSDALVIVVSEERGEVSLASGRDIVALETPDALIQAIRQRREPHPIGRARRLRQALVGDLAVKAAALGTPGGPGVGQLRPPHRGLRAIGHRAGRAQQCPGSARGLVSLHPDAAGPAPGPSVDPRVREPHGAGRAVRSGRGE